MSQKSIKLLHEVARARGMTETDVVETCVAKFALSIGQDVDRARELLFEQICRATANSPVDVASVRETGEDIAVEGRKGHKDVAATSPRLRSEAAARQDVESAGQSAAGALAITAGESASRKHGSAKK